ncbi:MAG: hypothetical protein MUP81_03250 [Dehalococcoidia bacterium]|nr:hypothetical protein [Dehalococcoidia bacterium]
MYLIIKHTFGQGKSKTVKTFGDDEEEAANEYLEDLKMDVLLDEKIGKIQEQCWYELKKL